jgi:hypothetical protein
VSPVATCPHRDYHVMMREGDSCTCGLTIPPKPCCDCGTTRRPRSACPYCGKVFCRPCAEKPYESCCDGEGDAEKEAQRSLDRIAALRRAPQGAPRGAR